MKRAVLILSASVLAVFVAPAGCRDGDEKKPSGKTVAPSAPSYPAEKQWTNEEIAHDPEAYMRWAGEQIDRQIADRQARRARLAERLVQVRRDRQALTDKMKDVENIRKRMDAAYRRAEDEDRFPFEIAGKSFDQARAKQILAETARYLADRESLAQSYDQAVTKLDAAVGLLAADIDQLKRLREKVAIDLEQVRLNQGVEELSVLRKHEADIAAFAKTLGAMADESLTTSLPVDTAPRINVEELLNR